MHSASFHTCAARFAALGETALSDLVHHYGPGVVEFRRRDVMTVA